MRPTAHLDGQLLDQSTFSKNRHGRYRDCDLARKLFETGVERCMTEGLIDGTTFAVDASLIAADANRQRAASWSDEVEWDTLAMTRRSLREHLDTLDEADANDPRRASVDLGQQEQTGVDLSTGKRTCLRKTGPWPALLLMHLL
jgi:hypothetical protein